MSDEIVFDVLCTKVLDALRALGLGKFSIRNYYYEGMWPIIKVYRCDEQNRQEEQPTNKANGNRKKLGRLKGAKTIAR